MNPSAEEVSPSALKLSTIERAALIDRLFDSIDREIDPTRRKEIEQRWAEESERRIDSVDRGDLKLVDGPGAMRKFRGAIRK